MTFGERVKELRKKNGYTQITLAETLGITKGTVSTWETNSRRPSFEMLNTLCDLFDVRLDYLTGQSDDATPPQKPSESDLDALALSQLSEDAIADAENYEYVLQKICSSYIKLDNFGRESLRKHLELELKRCEEQNTTTDASDFNYSVRVRPNLAKFQQ